MKKDLSVLQGLKEARGMLARWLVYLSSFDFKIIYRHGMRNLVADALRRTIITGDEEDNKPIDKYLPYPELVNIYHLQPENLTKIFYPTVSIEEWILETNKDYPLQKIMEAVKRGEAPSFEERNSLPFFFLNGTLTCMRRMSFCT